MSTHRDGPSIIGVRGMLLIWAICSTWWNRLMRILVGGMEAGGCFSRHHHFRGTCLLGIWVMWKLSIKCSTMQSLSIIILDDGRYQMRRMLQACFWAYPHSIKISVIGLTRSHLLYPVQLRLRSRQEDHFVLVRVNLLRRAQRHRFRVYRNHLVTWRLTSLLQARFQLHYPNFFENITHVQGERWW